MKKISAVFAAIFAIIGVAFFPLATHASTYVMNESYSIGTDETVEGNVYAVGSTITINGKVTGDFIGGANSVALNGTFDDDVLVAGGTITLSGTVNDDFRAGGGTIVLSGTINGDVNVAGGDVTFDKNSVVTGDVTVAGGVVTLAGRVDQNVAFAGGNVSVSGTILGNIDGQVETLTITDGATIHGNLTYSAPEEASISSGATVAGTVTFTKHTAERLGSYYGLVGLSIASFVINLLATAILLLALVLLCNRLSSAVANEGLARFWNMFLTGLVLCIVMPIASIMLMITIVGIPIGLFLLAVYILLLILGGLYAHLLIGSLILQWIQKKQVALDWKVVCIGVIVLSAVVLVPLVGWLIGLVFFFAGVGSTSVVLYRLLGKKESAT